MNQDNQVGWMKEFDDSFPEGERRAYDSYPYPLEESERTVLKSFISRVAQDSYETGYRDGESSKTADMSALLDENPEDFKRLYGEGFIEQIKKDSYAEGIRRAREVVEKVFADAKGCIQDCEIGWDCQGDTKGACLKALEEEVKK